MYIQSRVKGIDSGYKLCQLLSGMAGSADKVVNDETVEIRFEAVVLIENWCSIKPKKKQVQLGPILVLKATPSVCFQKLPPNDEQLSASTISAERIRVSELGSLPVR